MASNTVGQIACPNCDSVAEIRRRANGQKLPFLCCKNCGQTQTKNEELRESWLQNMVPDGELGEYGQKIESVSNVSSVDAGLKQQADIKQSSKEWTPPNELKPEIIEPASKTEISETHANTKKKSTNWGFALKAVLAMGGLLVAGYGAGKLSNLSSIHGK